MDLYLLQNPELEKWKAELRERDAASLADEREFADALSRLEGLDVCDETRAIFQRYLNKELTSHGLNQAIDDYLRPNRGSQS